MFYYLNLQIRMLKYFKITLWANRIMQEKKIRMGVIVLIKKTLISLIVQQEITEKERKHKKNEILNVDFSCPLISCLSACVQ